MEMDLGQLEMDLGQLEMDLGQLDNSKQFFLCFAGRGLASRSEAGYYPGSSFSTRGQVFFPKQCGNTWGSYGSSKSRGG